MLALTEKYRPSRIADHVGQSAVVAALRRFIQSPVSMSIIFSGATGLGKTSMALALARELGCDMRPSCADMGGLYQIAAGEQTADAVRGLSKRFWNIPMFGSGWRLILVNEADQCSKQAQVVWLDVLENLPARTVVVFTTNDLRGLEPRFIDRCLHIPFVSGSGGETLAAANSLIARIWAGERPGEPVPLAADIDAFEPGKLISYRRVVQACARRLLDPAPHVVTPIAVALWSSPDKPIVKPVKASGPKPFWQLTPRERELHDAAMLRQMQPKEAALAS